ncbi:MAG: disulfide bond formation protein B [Pseudomonadota bacterium]
MTLRLTGLFGLAIMVAAIATAWGFQLIGGLIPCALCLEQRVPYYAAIPLAAAAVILAGLTPLLPRILLLGAAIAMVYGAGLGVYHAGAEWAFWAGPNTCGDTGAAVTNAAGLLGQMEDTTFVSCTQDTGRVLGLSFAGWNVVSASFAALLLVAAATRPIKR